MKNEKYGGPLAAIGRSLTKADRFVPCALTPLGCFAQAA
jgi:hypothetical protein